MKKDKKESIVKWIKAEDRSPKEHETVLVYSQEDAFMVAIYENGKYWWDIPDDTADWYTEATHWMPLPDAPAERKN